MEDNDKLEEQEYILGYNEGYIMSKYSPEIGELLPIITTKSYRLDGMKAGKEQFEVEQSHEKLPSWLKDDPFTKKDIEPEMDVDIEPEI